MAFSAYPAGINDRGGNFGRAGFEPRNDRQSKLMSTSQATHLLPLFSPKQDG